MNHTYLKHCLAATAAAVIVTLGTPQEAPAATNSPNIVGIGVGTLTLPGGDSTALVDAFGGVLRRLARALTLKRS